MRLEPAFFGWLGGVPYLTLEAFRSTIATIGALARWYGGELRLRRFSTGDTQRQTPPGVRHAVKARGGSRRTTSIVFHS